MSVLFGLRLHRLKFKIYVTLCSFPYAQNPIIPRIALKTCHIIANLDHKIYNIKYMKSIILNKYE